MTLNEVIDLIQEWIVTNGNEEITADVLRPILEAMVNQPNDLIGDKDDLTTTDKDNLVEAINEVRSLAITNAGLVIHSGSGTPIETPPVSVGVGDFYAQVIFPSSTVVTFWQYNGSVWVQQRPQRTRTVLKFVSLIGITTAGKSQVEWMAEAINLNISNGAVYECEDGDIIDFFVNVSDITADRASVRRIYTRLCTGATSVTSVVANDLMPDGSEEIAVEGDLIIELGDIGSDDVWTAFNADPNQPFDMDNEMFVSAIQDGEPKLWQWIGGTGTFGSTATLATADDFLDLTAQPSVPSEVNKLFYEDIPAMLAHQQEQGLQHTLCVADASADQNITFPSGETRLQAYYRYLGTTNGTMVDYELISAPYGNHIPNRKEIKTISDTTYTLLESDKDKILQFTSATDLTVTVPTGLTLGNRFEGKQLGDGQIIFVGATGVTINTLVTKNNKTEDKYSVFKLDSTGTDDYVLYGNLELVGREKMYLSYNPTTSLNLLIETASGDDWEIDWGDGVWERYASSSSTYRTKTFGSSTSGVARVKSATGRGLSDINRLESTQGYWSFDATAISGLTSLTYFRLNGSGLTGDMTGVSSLTSLTYLLLSGGGFTGNMAGVSSLTSLGYLYLNGSGFTGNMSGVSSLTSLTSLNLNGSGFTGNMSGISSLTSLTFLRVIGSGFTGNMAGVSGLTSLTTLNFTGSGFTGDMSGVSGLTLLTSLYLDGSGFTGDMSGVSGLSSLTTLYFNGNSFTGNMAGVSGLTSLTSLNLSGNSFTGDMSGVSSLTSLTTLYLSGSGFTGNMSGVSSLTSLTSLHLAASGFTGDMSGVSGLTSLTYLVLAATSESGFTLTYSTFTANLATLTLILKAGELSNPVDIDQLFIDIDAVATTKSGTFDLRSTGAAAPTSASAAARASLVSKGRTILTN